MAKKSGEEDIKKVAKETSVVVEDALRSIANNIGNIFAEALSNSQDLSKSLVKDVQGGLNSLVKVSTLLAETNEKAVNGALTQRDITKELEKRNAKIFAIKSQIEIAERNGLKISKEQRAELDGIEQSNEEIAKTLQEQLKYSDKIQKAMGLTGVALGGAEKLATKLGLSGLDNVFAKARDAARDKAKALVDAGKSAGSLATKIKVMGAGLKTMAKGLASMFSPGLIIGGLFSLAKKAFGFLKEGYERGKEAAMKVSEENVAIARSLGLAQGAANQLAGSVAGMGPTAEASKQSITSIYEAMGSTEKLTKSTLSTFVKLNTFAGFSAEALAKFQKFAKASGQDAGVMVEAMADTALEVIKTNKLSISQKNLMTEVANVSNLVKIRFAGQPKELVKAVAATKALGLDMEKVKNIADGLLNIEDSIAAEMEAELLTGKDLNLEKARELALAGKSEEAAKLIADQMGGAAEFSKMNVVQQESLAKVLGMNRDGMADMLAAQEENKSVNGDLVDGQKDGLKAMQSGVSVAEKEANIKRASEEASMSFYNRIAPIVDRLRMAWASIRKIMWGLFDKQVVKPIVDWFNSAAGNKFIDDLPKKAQQFANYINKNMPTWKKEIREGAKYLGEVIGNMKQWIANNPWIKNVAAGLATSGVLTALKMRQAIRGTTKFLPSYVEVTNMPIGGGFGDSGGGGDSVSKMAGKAGFFKQLKTLFTKPSLMFRALSMKGGMFGKIIGKTGMFLGKFGGKLGLAGGLLGKFGGALSKGIGSLFSGLKGMTSKAGGFLSSMWKGAKSLGSKALSGAKSLGSKAWSGAKSLGGKALGGLKSAGGAIGNVAGKAWSGIKKGASAVGSAVSKLNPIKLLKSGLFKNATKWIGKAFKGGLLGALLNIGSIGMILAGKDTPLNKAKQLIPMGASIIGSILGSMVGSLLPGPGTLIGGIAGGLLGDWIGSLPALQKVLAPPIAKVLGGDDVAEDFVMQGGKIQKFRKDDIVLGGTNPFGAGKGGAGGGGGDPKVVMLLERLISAVERGGNVYIDGQKVGRALTLSNYRQQ